MNISFEDKVAVITGGTAGIGLSIAEAFGRSGAKVGICGRSNGKIKSAIEYLNGIVPDIYAENVDVSIKAEIFKFADNIEKKFGKIDIWINNASIYPQYQIVDTPEEVWEKVLKINLNSVYYGALIAKEKLSKNGGVLINAASFASLMPSIGSGAYAATKAAVYSMTKTLAGELAPYKIRVCGYIPGVIETDMTLPLIKNDGNSLKSSIALNKIGKSKDIANGVLFLASDLADYITGTFLEISGGKFCVQNPNAAW